MGRSPTSPGESEGNRQRPRGRATALIAYFDTSAFLKLVVDEPGSAEMTSLWETADRRVSSRLLYPEACSALAAAERARRFDTNTFGAAQRELERLWSGIEDVELSRALTIRAGDLSRHMALTASDAVHLATAEAVIDTDDIVACTDARLASGARALGLAVASGPQSSPG